MSPKIGISDIRREELTLAAMKCIAEKGYDRVTLDDVTRQAGLSKGIASYYFNNREDLLISVMQRMWDNVFELTQKVWDLPEDVQGTREVCKQLKVFYADPDIDLLAVIKTGTKSLFLWMENNPNIMKVILEFWCQVPRNTAITELNNAMHKYLLDISAIFIQEGIKRGIFKKRNPRSAAYTLISAWIGFALNQVVFQGKFNTGRLEKDINEMVLSYLMA